MSGDLVFSCPSCRKPLVVEPAAAGTRITCPLCRSAVTVPVVKRAEILGFRRGGGAGGKVGGVSDFRQRSRVTDLLYDLHEQADARLRGLVELEEQVALVDGAVGLMRDRLSVLDRHMVSVAYRRTPSDTVQIPETWTPVPQQSLWRSLTLGFGALAFLLALFLAMRV